MIDTINPNITAGIGAGESNPLNMIYRLAATQNALNQNALFQQTFRARQALGPLAQQSIDPQTGEMDWNKLVTLAATHPDTAFIAQDIANNAAQKKLLDANTANAELVGTQHRMDIMAPILARAVNDPNVKTGADLVPHFQDIMAAGGIKDGNQKDMINLLAQFAPLKGPELKQRLLAFAQANEQGRKALSDFNGTFNPTGGYDPASGQAIPVWVKTAGVGGQVSPIMPGGEQPITAPVTGPPGAPTQPNFAPGAPSEAQKKVWSDTESMREDYNAQDARGQQIQVVRKQLQNALDQIHAGAGAGAYQNFAQFLQSIGVGHNLEKPDKDILNAAANGNLPAGQTADSLSTLLGTMAVRDLLLSKSKDEGSAGRLTNLEFGKIVDQFPNKEKDPGYNVAMMDFMDRQYALRHLKAQTFNKIYNDYHGHKALPGGMTNPTQFEPYWGEQLMKNNAIPSLGGQ